MYIDMQSKAFIFASFTVLRWSPTIRVANIIVVSINKLIPWWILTQTIKTGVNEKRLLQCTQEYSHIHQPVGLGGER